MSATDNTETHPITTNYTKPLANLAFPIATGIMVQTCYHIVNAFWVGRLGADAVAVISLAFPINLVLMSLASGLALGGTILITQRHGAEQHDQVNHLVAQTLSGMALLAVIIAVIGVAISPTIPGLLGAADAIYEDSTLFLQITFAGSLFSFLCMTFQYALRGLGEAKAPLMIIFPSVVINAILDPLLIFGWGPIPAMGVQGAAWATVLTQMLTAIAGVWLLHLPRFGLQLRTKLFSPNWQTLKQLFKLGIPASVEQSVGALSVSVMTLLASGFGTMALASYGIVFRLLTFTMIPAVGISMATSILLGKSLGGGNMQAGRSIAVEACMINAVMMSLIGGGLFLFAPLIASLFVPSDPQLSEYCATVLRFFALSYPFSGVHSALTGTFRGAGDTVSAMVLSLVGVWVLQIPLACVLAWYTPLQDMGLWWSILIAAVLSLIIAIGYYKTQRWLKAFQKTLQ